MKKLFINPKGNVVLDNVKVPHIETQGLLVKTSYALISSGTELTTLKFIKLQNSNIITQFLKSSYIRKTILAEIKKNSFKGILNLFKIFKEQNINKNFSPPSKKLISLGYSCSGIVLEGNLENFRKNDRVACAGSNHAEITYSSKNLTCRIPDNVSLKEAAFATLGAIALHSIHRADIKPGEYVGVIGTGLIGLIVVQLAKLSGAHVFAFDTMNTRLNLAKNLGADTIINPFNQNSIIKVNEITMGHGLDSIIIGASSKSSKPLEDAVDLIRERGKIVLLGGFPIKVDRSKLYYKEADLLISRSYGPGRYDSYYEYKGFDYPKKFVPWTEQRNMEIFLKLISEKKVNVKTLISEVIPADNANLAYKKLEEDPINNIAILLEFLKEPIKITESKIIPKKIQKKLTIGLIGCGNFAQSTHLPILLPHPSCKIKGICTRSKKKALYCKQQYKPDFTTTNYRKILEDPEIETVFIYTRHNTHAKYSIESIRANKNVFAEKPMGLTMDQCLDVYNAVKISNLKYTIGFNRRYSTLIQRAKDLLNRRDNPIIINYRIANEFIPGTHWAFNPEEGGGLLIGELCHFTDLILFLMNSKPVEVIARGGTLSHKNTDLFDSCVAIIKFENGSIGNIIYTDLNGPNMPKERIEIFSGDSTIIIDDFIKLKSSGFDFGNLYLNQQDKGHKSQLNNVIQNNLGLVESLTDVNDAIRAMDLVFKTIESIKMNKAIRINSDIYE